MDGRIGVVVGQGLRHDVVVGADDVGVDLPLGVDRPSQRTDGVLPQLAAEEVERDGIATEQERAPCRYQNLGTEQRGGLSSQTERATVGGDSSAQPKRGRSPRQGKRAAAGIEHRPTDHKGGVARQDKRATGGRPLLNLRRRLPCQDKSAHLPDKGLCPHKRCGIAREDKAARAACPP